MSPWFWTVGVRWRCEAVRWWRVAGEGGDVLGVDQAEGGADIGDLDDTVAVGGEGGGVGLSGLRHGCVWCLKTHAVQLAVGYAPCMLHVDFTV